MITEQPQGNRLRLLLASAAIAALSGFAVLSSLDATDRLDHQAQMLVDEEIPNLRTISALLSETERASLELHLYYATQSLAHWEAVEASDTRFGMLLEDFQGEVEAAELVRLREERRGFEAQARAFHVEMQTRPGRSWDRMRDLLSTAHGHTQVMSDVLAAWANRIQTEVQRGGEQTMAELRRLSVLQSGFTVALGGWALGLIVLYRARIRDQRSLHRLAYFDTVSELPNRRHFLDAWRADNAKRGAALLQVGIDDFKAITSTFGHSLAQELARAVAGSIVRTVDAAAEREHQVFSLSNSEWLVWVVEPRPVAVRSLADGLLDALGDRLTVSGFDIPLAVSIGIACAPEHGVEGEQLLRNAEAALQASQQSGSRRPTLFSPDSSTETRRFLDTQLALGDALVRDEFELHLQPKIDTASGRCIGAEGLLRWRHDGRLVPPGDFIPVAERSGLIEPIGAWVIEEGARLATELRAAGIADLPVAVNVSPRQLADPAFAQDVARIVRRHDLPPAALELEITEAAMLGGSEAIGVMLDELRDLGVRLAIDDFGTGYSSLSYLTRFPFDVLKIDRRFITNMIGSTRDRHVVRSILSLADALDFDVIAEGVETDEQVDALRELGCEHVQGFLYSRPLPFDEFKRFAAAAGDAASPSRSS
ncbi:MAG: bifunctional diguanylate cyclase/phosphodiesterase, partial [Pseudomonadota bacterium]